VQPVFVEPPDEFLPILGVEPLLDRADDDADVVTTARTPSVMAIVPSKHIRRSSSPTRPRAMRVVAST
jgi:hypothetical protein